MFLFTRGNSMLHNVLTLEIWVTWRKVVLPLVTKRLKSKYKIPRWLLKDSWQTVAHPRKYFPCKPLHIPLQSNDKRCGLYRFVQQILVTSNSLSGFTLNLRVWVLSPMFYTLGQLHFFKKKKKPHKVQKTAFAGVGQVGSNIGLSHFEMTNDPSYHL